MTCQTSFPSEPSAFRESPLSPSEIANYLRDELKRLRKRKQLAPYPHNHQQSGTGNQRPSPPASPGSPEPMMAELIDRASSPSKHRNPTGLNMAIIVQQTLFGKARQ